MLDKEIVSVKNFKGLFLQGTDPVDITALGAVDGNILSYAKQSNTPLDNAFDINNLIFQKNGGLRTRNGFKDYIQASHTATPFTVSGIIVGMWAITNLNGVEYTDRWLILAYNSADNTGRFYDTQVPVTATNPVMAIVGMKYAFVINAFSRMYISPWEAWASPLTGTNGFIWLYNGLYQARMAGGVFPSIGTFAVTATAGGNATPGLHFASVLFETDSGFRTQIIMNHDVTPLTVTTTTANATMSFANIPVGAAGSGVTKRHILISKIVVNNNGQGFRGYEPFIAITINDNTTTTATYANPDSALVDSGQDYIYKNTNIRSQVSMAQYGNRLVYLGSRVYGGGYYPYLQDTIAVSDPNTPEHVYDLLGFTGERNILLIGEGYVGNVMTGFEQNGAFYIFKDSSTHSIIDSPDDDPSTWPINLIDAGKGAYPLGAALVGPNPSGFLSGGAFIVGSHGISYFNGRHSEYTLTENIWDKFAFTSITSLKWSHLVIDPIRKIIFWKYGDPTNAGDVNNFCHTLDYFEGITPDKIKISKWADIPNSVEVPFNFPNVILRKPGTYGTEGGSLHFNTNYPLLTVVFHNTDTPTGATNLAIIYSESILKDDRGVAIPWLYETGYSPNDNGEIYQFSNLRMRLTNNYDALLTTPGSPDIGIEFGILDDINYTTLASILAPGNTPKKFKTVPINAQAEQIRLKISGQSRVFIQQLVLFGSKVGLDRPR